MVGGWDWTFTVTSAIYLMSTIHGGDNTYLTVANKFKKDKGIAHIRNLNHCSILHAFVPVAAIPF